MDKVKTFKNIVWCFIAEYGFCIGIYFLLKTKLDDFFWAECWLLACLAYFLYATVEFALDYIDREKKNEEEDIEKKQED